MITDQDRTIYVNLKKLEERYSVLESGIPELEKLIDTCREQNIPTDYEMVNFTVLKSFIEYGREDIQKDFIERAIYVVDVLEGLYSVISENLTAYLKKEKASFSVPRLITSDVNIEGFSFIGKTRDSKTGKIQSRPVFYTGYGHFNQVRKDIGVFNDYGNNIIQIELGPDSVIFKSESISNCNIDVSTDQTIFEAENPNDIPVDEKNDCTEYFKISGDYGIKTGQIMHDIQKVLKAGEESNVAVNLLLAVHYFPRWAFEKWKGLKGNNKGFIKYIIHHPKCKELIRLYLETIIPMIKDYRSLHSVCISNEPVYNSSLDDYNLPAWHAYLESVYGCIDQLNGVYTKAYSDFEDVPMPKEMEASPWYYDWVIFNNRLFSDWHKWIADIIKELAPKIPVHSKMMSIMGVCDNDYNRNYIKYGTDPEQWAEFSQLSGNDSWNFYGRDHLPLNNKLQWYDLLTSIKKVPIYNSEDHIIEDWDDHYIPEQAIHAGADMWQGAVHGRSAATAWIWERTYQINHDAMGSVLHRPDVVSVIGKTNLDLNRLSYEVTALQNIIPDVAILYSTTARVYSRFYMNGLFKSYEAVTFSGQKAGFVTEKQIADGKLSQYKALIVPEATHVLASTFNGIRTFIKNGGHVVILGEESLAKDEHNHTFSQADRTDLINNAKVIQTVHDESFNILKPATIEIRDMLIEILEELDLNKVILVDNNTNKPVFQVEWVHTVFEGKTLLNVCNYDWHSVKYVTVKVPGVKANTLHELIEDKTFSSGIIELKPYKPQLLCIDL